MLRFLLLLLAVSLALAQSPPTEAEARAGNRPPQVLALNVTPSAPRVGESVRLRAFGEDPEADALRWTWTIDGVRQDTDQPELLLMQPAGGEYEVRVVADDGRGGVADAELRFKVFQPTWCAEAASFHDEATLTAHYSGAPSLTLDRPALIEGFMRVLRDYRAAGGTPVSNPRSEDTATVARSLDAVALPTGHEAAIRAAARARAGALGRGLTPPELFAIALEAHGGNVRDALLAGHAATYRDADGANARFVRDQLAPLRDIRGYSRERALRTWNARRGEWEFAAAAELVGTDQQGAWLALYGAAALAFVDRHDYTPYWLLAEGAGFEPPVWSADRGDPTATVNALSNGAVALLQQAQNRGRRAPDPDLHCMRYGGAAIGAALARELDPAAPAVTMPTAMPGTPSGSYLIQPPLSIELIGTGGEQVGFDAGRARFTGNTPNAIVTFTETADGAMVLTPLFPVREIALGSAGNGTAQFGAADLDAGFSRVWALTLTAEARLRYTPAYALTDATGRVVEHAAEVHHDRRWTFPQAPMLIIGVTSVFGLLLGLIWVWRRGPFAPAPSLPTGSAPADRAPQCSACGATTRPGARFCRQCGRQLR